MNTLKMMKEIYEIANESLANGKDELSSEEESIFQDKIKLFSEYYLTDIKKAKKARDEILNKRILKVKEPENVNPENANFIGESSKGNKRKNTQKGKQKIKKPKIEYDYSKNDFITI
uniref:Uncharacterized protein n=1 Tax=Meloidogyne hapla TaxID=6305 RepID=A0A1I8BIL6_MELHA